MADAGGRPLSFTTPAGSRIATTGIGLTATAVGIGFRIIRGVEQRFTTVVGFIIRAMAGAGGRTQLGDRRGSRGVIPAIIVAGRRCHHTRLINRASGSFFKAAQSVSGLILV